MSVDYSSQSDNEINFLELFATLWRGKIYIFLFILISILFATVYLHKVERKYTVQYKLLPVTESKKGNSFDNLGGLASLAGVQLSSPGSNDFKIFQELLNSVEVSEILMADEELIKNIFSAEWNASQNNYNAVPKSKSQNIKSSIKKLLTGYADSTYIPPNSKRLKRFFSYNTKIAEDSNTGFLSISSETARPKLILSLIIAATEASDEIMRQRYIEFSTEPLAFYKNKLRTARSREHRQALAQLIGGEEQKLMLASRGKYFIAKPLINPTITMLPTSPKISLVLVLSLVLGLSSGIVLVLVRNAYKKDN